MALSGPDTAEPVVRDPLPAAPPRRHLPHFGRVTAGMHVLHALDTTDRIEAVRVERLMPEAVAAGTAPDAGPAPDAGALDDVKPDDASDSDDSRTSRSPDPRAPARLA